MRLFTFTTTSNPKYSGEGVDWEDGRATYRHSVNGSEFYGPSTGQVSDIEYQYGGLPGYSFDYADES
jgi:hypothetical protein